MKHYVAADGHKLKPRIARMVSRKGAKLDGLIFLKPGRKLLMNRMVGFIFRLVFGVLGVLFGTSIIIWVLYNYLVQRQPEFSGPRFFCGFGAAVPMVTVGIYWLRNLRRKAEDKPLENEDEQDY